MTTTTGGALPGADHGGRRHAWEVPTPMESMLICPTCLVRGDDAEGCDPFVDQAPAVRPEACPTCGFVSAEWGLGVLIDRTLVELLGLERLDAAIREMV